MSYKIKPVACAMVAVLLSSAYAFAQSAGGAGGATGGAAGTNSAGTANATGGSGGGAGGTRSEGNKPTTGDAKVDAQDRAVDRKVKSICKGC